MLELASKLGARRPQNLAPSMALRLQGTVENKLPWDPPGSLPLDTGAQLREKALLLAKALTSGVRGKPGVKHPPSWGLGMGKGEGWGWGGRDGWGQRQQVLRDGESGDGLRPGCLWLAL